MSKSLPKTTRVDMPFDLTGPSHDDPGPVGDTLTPEAINAWRTNAEVLRELARYGAGLPGRKNLIWFSGYFPLYFLQKPFLDPVILREFREGADMLAGAQVAVYPVNARGVRGGLPDMDRNEVAAMTGGRSFQNQNYMDEVTAEAIDDGSNYYTIAYTPSDMRWNGDYRHIQVKVNLQGAELSYRQGFYADDPNAPMKAGVSAPGGTNSAEHVGAEAAGMSKAMKDAMEYGVPDAIEIPFVAQVRPVSAGTEPELATGNHAPSDVKGPYRRYAVDFSVDPHAVGGEESNGARHGRMEFVTFVYGADAKLVNTVGTAVRADIPQAALVEGSKQWVPGHEEVSVPAKGAFFLHIAVHDLTNDRVGTIEIPVSELPVSR